MNVCWLVRWVYENDLMTLRSSARLSRRCTINHARKHRRSLEQKMVRTKVLISKSTLDNTVQPICKFTWRTPNAEFFIKRLNRMYILIG